MVAAAEDFIFAGLSKNTFYIHTQNFWGTSLKWRRLQIWRFQNGNILSNRLGVIDPAESESVLRLTSSLSFWLFFIANFEKSSKTGGK